MFVVQAMYNTVQPLSVLQAPAKPPHALAAVARTAQAPAVYRQTSIQSAIVAVAAMSAVQLMSHTERVSSAHPVHAEPQPVIPAIVRRMVHAHPETPIPMSTTAEAAVMFVVQATCPMAQALSAFPEPVKRLHAVVTTARSMEAVSQPV